MKLNTTASDILNQITDEICEKGYFYFNTELADQAYIGGRIYIFWDNRNWEICFETINYGITIGGLVNSLCWFGNGSDITKTSSQKNIIFRVLLEDGLIESIINSENNNQPNYNRIINVENQDIEYPAAHEVLNYIYKACPDYRRDSTIYGEDLIRYLIDFYPESFYLDEMSVKSLLQIKLPLKMIVKEWHHEQFNCYNGIEGIPPRNNESLINIAEMIEKRDTSIFKPSPEPNTHWKNWWLTY